MEFLTVDSAVAQTEVKRSRFICRVRHCETENAAKEFVAEIKKQNALATHNCYAYSVWEDGVLRVKYSDDGEPQGTAGLPILGAIKSRGLQCVACVVTRFFGGIKLGTGGLSRAYADACRAAFDSASVSRYVLCARFLVETDYESYRKFALVKLGENAFCTAPQFCEKVLQTVYVKEENAAEFLDNFDGVFCKRQSISRLSSIMVRFPDER